jgi:hypothetical protein
MIHLRIVAPDDVAHKALELLCASPAVINVVHLQGASRKPRGDVILCDITREDASVIISDLKELEVPKVGSIAIEHVDTSISDAAKAAEKAAPGLPSRGDADRRGRDHPRPADPDRGSDGRRS